MILNFAAKLIVSFTKSHQNEKDIFTDCSPVDDG